MSEMNILDLHVNCHVALHPKQMETVDSVSRYNLKNTSSFKETPPYNSINMDYEDSAFKYQPYKKTTNDFETSSINYQNASLYNVYDKLHYYSMNPSDRYGTSEHHNGIIPFGSSTYSDQTAANSYMDLGYRRYDFYGQVYDQPDSGFYPYASNLNPYFNFHDNSHQASAPYYSQKNRYQFPQNSYQNLHDEDISDRKPDSSGRWYSVPTGRRACVTANHQDCTNSYNSQGSSLFDMGQKSNNFQDKSTKGSIHSSSCEQKQTSQYGKTARPTSTGKSPTNFTLHVRKQERKLKKRLKELQSKNCDKATQLQEYYHYKVIMIEKQAQQLQETDSIIGCIESSQETDVQILQLIHEMEERINGLQYSLSEELSEKYGQVCGEVRKTRLLPKHAIKTLETWYEENLSNPYPSRDQTVRLALDCTLTIEQVRKWFANKRNRSRNNKLHLMK